MRTTRHWLAAFGTSLALLFATPTLAQTPVIERGDAVVSGFSGTVTPQSVPDGIDPIDLTTLNMAGPSARILDLEAGGQPPQGQIIGATPGFDIKAIDVGQVFGIALDDGKFPELGVSGPPNIYLTATSAFGLQIVGADSNGDGLPDRLKTGQAGASWMPGQFGLGKGGGPGSVWRVDGQTGAVTLLANVTLNGVANPGNGLGNITFDARSRQLFVSDRATGMIHRMDLTGVDLGYYDHGVEGRTAKGLPPVAYDAAAALNITLPAFNAEDANTWAFAPKPRAVWGVRVLGDRLYYAVAEGPQVWSIGIALDGSFAGDPRLEIEVTETPAGNAISDITFDGDATMYLAQRGDAKGDYAFRSFAEPKTAALIRYHRETPDDPATPGIWVLAPEEYAVGFPPEHRNTNGGVALGYGYRDGSLYRGTCGRMVWTTGEALRVGAGLGGPEAVHGLQGMERPLVRPANVPPMQTYFADYDSAFADPDVNGHMGDVEVWQPCEGASIGYSVPGTPLPPFFPPTPPSGTFNLTLTKQATPYICVAGGIGWQCNYTVTVTNTGTLAYQGPLTVDDWLPASPAGAVMTFAPQPPWACAPLGPTHFQCTDPGLLLYPGESTAISVTVQLPADYADCYLDNGAAIVWPAGYADANPYDDSAYATAAIPNERCNPPDDKKTNLRLKKFSLLDRCVKLPSNDFLCIYGVTITNTGPNVYEGPIVVTDTPEAGLAAIFAPSPPWACVGANPYTCTHPPVVLNPGQNVALAVGVIVPAGFVKPGQCRIRNKAEINFAPGGTDQNWNPADDADSASAQILSKDCLEPRTNLKIEKFAMPNCKLGQYPPLGNGWACIYAIKVTNTGPGVYNGTVTVRDTLPIAPIATVFALQPPWACVGGGTDYDCSRPNTVLNPGQHVILAVGVLLPANTPAPGKCEIVNKAKITQAPGGSPQNVNPADDTAQASAHIPSERCDKPRTNLRLDKRSLGPCSLGTFDGYGTGYACGFRVRVTNTGPGTYNGPLVVTDTLGTLPVATVLGPQPPWSCVGGGTTYTCTRPNTLLLNGQSVDLMVSSVIPPAYARESCKIENSARIDQAPGGSAQNTNPGDDQDTASAALLAPNCQPDPQTAPPVPQQEGSPSLNKTCSAIAVGGSSTCVVTVRNNGPGPLSGPVRFTDAAVYLGGGGVLPIQTVTPDGGDWSCSGLPNSLSCELPAASLPAGATRSITVVMQPLNPGQGPDVRFRNCASLPNQREVCAEAGGDVTVIKTAPATCTAGQACTFGITLSNSGTSAFTGSLMLSDAMTIGGGAPAGATISAISPPLGCSPDPTSLPFSCAATMTLAPGESRMHQITVQLPANISSTAINGRNCFMVVDNRVASNVAVSASGLPAGSGQGYSCADFRITKIADTCPGDLVRVGTQCKCPKEGQRRVGDQCKGGGNDTPVPPVVLTCKAPMVGAVPNCRCPSGLIKQGSTCVQPEPEDQPQACKPPRTGIAPNCKCPDARPVWNGETCVKPPTVEKCDAPRLGTKPNCRCPDARPVWTGETCVKPPTVEKCDAPRLGIKPNCRCPDARPVWNGETCTPRKPTVEKCDAPRLGIKPNCKCPANRPTWTGSTCVDKPIRQKCDAPKVGFKPNCVCPKGTQSAGSGCRPIKVINPGIKLPGIIKQLQNLPTKKRPQVQQQAPDAVQRPNAKKLQLPKLPDQQKQ